MRLGLGLRHALEHLEAFQPAVDPLGGIRVEALNVKNHVEHIFLGELTILELVEDIAEDRDVPLRVAAVPVADLELDALDVGRLLATLHTGNLVAELVDLHAVLLRGDFHARARVGNRVLRLRQIGLLQVAVRVLEDGAM